VNFAGLGAMVIVGFGAGARAARRQRHAQAEDRFVAALLEPADRTSPSSVMPARRLALDVRRHVHCHAIVWDRIDVDCVRVNVAIGVRDRDFVDVVKKAEWDLMPDALRRRRAYERILGRSRASCPRHRCRSCVVRRRPYVAGREGLRAHPRAIEALIWLKRPALRDT
jgi:hypothetical protein